jgi:hypothetical protein
MTPLLLLLAVAAPAAGDVPLPPPPPGATLQPGEGAPRVQAFALLAGFLSQRDVASPCLQLDFARDATPPGWTRAALEWHLPIRVARPDWDAGLTRTVVVPVAYGGGSYLEPVGTTHDTVWLVEAIPTARVVFPAAKGFSFHAEAGLGLSQSAARHVEDEVFVGHTVTRKLVLAPALRVAAGLSYRVGEKLELVMQPFALGRRLFTHDSSFSALWGLSYRP